MASVRKVDRITSITKQREYYSDFATDFTIKPNGDLERLTNDDSVRQSIVNLISTNKGEVFFSERGGDVRKLLFENMTPQVESMLESTIRHTIENYEPRAKINNIIVRGDETDGSYSINILFTTINTSDVISLSFILTRVR